MLCKQGYENTGPELWLGLTHRLKTLVSSFDGVYEHLAHPLLGEQADATVEESDHNGIPLVRRIGHVISASPLASTHCPRTGFDGDTYR